MSDSPSTAEATRSRGTRTPLYLAVTYAAKGLQVALALVCTPIYLQQLGPAGFGVIGLFLSIQRVATLFDSGFSRAINREMAGTAPGPQAGETLRTLEVVYLAITALLLSIAFATSGSIASSWGESDARTLVPLMAAAIAAQAPSNYYGAVLAGLECHVTLNLLQIAWHTTRFVGGALLLLASPTLVAFFSWQLATAGVFTLASAACAWHAAPAGFLTARFRSSRLRAVRNYAGGATLCAVTAVLVTQLDKLILCRRLSADEFGFYMLGWSLAASLFIAVSPISSIFFPRLSRLVLEDDSVAVRRMYHAGSQLVAVVVIPLAAVGAILSWHALHGWLGDQDVAASCWVVTSLLATGVGINCLCLMPHTLQLATGWTGLSNRLNLGAIFVFGPGVYFASTVGGGIGAGIAWVVFSIGFLLIQVIRMHQRLLKTDLWPWLQTQATIAVGCVVTVAAVAWALPVESRLGSLLVVMTAWTAAAAVACLLSPLPRSWLEARVLKPRPATLTPPGEPCRG